MSAQRAAAVDFVGLLTEVLDPADWRWRALCAETDPEAFYPEKGGSVRDAKRTCGNCDVRVECLAYALDRDERFGIWGGLSERERRRERQRRQAQREAQR